MPLQTAPKRYSMTFWAMELQRPRLALGFLNSVSIRGLLRLPLVLRVELVLLSLFCQRLPIFRQAYKRCPVARVTHLACAREIVFRHAPVFCRTRQHRYALAAYSLSMPMKAAA
jgi:hypothetical protein